MTKNRETERAFAALRLSALGTRYSATSSPDADSLGQQRGAAAPARPGAGGLGPDEGVVDGGDGAFGVGGGNGGDQGDVRVLLRGASTGTPALPSTSSIRARAPGRLAAPSPTAATTATSSVQPTSASKSRERFAQAALQVGAAGDGVDQVGHPAARRRLRGEHDLDAVLVERRRRPPPRRPDPPAPARRS